MQAMILAAGLGTRLRPLTTTCPKPLVPIAGKPLIDYHLERLVVLGVQEVFINVSYLADQIMSHCGDGSRYGLRIRYSLEADGPLGVLAGIRLAMQRGLRGSFLLISADIWLDIPADHSFFMPGDANRLLLIPKPERYETGDFGLSDTGQLTEDKAQYTYGGMAFFTTDFFESSAEGFAAVIQSHIATGTVEGRVYRGAYFNVGTADELAAAERYVTKK